MTGRRDRRRVWRFTSASCPAHCILVFGNDGSFGPLYWFARAGCPCYVGAKKSSFAGGGCLEFRTDFLAEKGRSLRSGRGVPRDMGRLPVPPLGVYGELRMFTAFNPWAWAGCPCYDLAFFRFRGRAKIATLANTINPAPGSGTLAKAAARSDSKLAGAPGMAAGIVVLL